MIACQRTPVSQRFVAPMHAVFALALQKNLLTACLLFVVLSVVGLFPKASLGQGTVPLQPYSKKAAQNAPKLPFSDSGVVWRYLGSEEIDGFIVAQLARERQSTGTELLPITIATRQVFAFECRTLSYTVLSEMAHLEIDGGHPVTLPEFRPGVQSFVWKNSGDRDRTQPYPAELELASFFCSLHQADLSQFEIFQGTLMRKGRANDRT